MNDMSNRTEKAKKITLIGLYVNIILTLFKLTAGIFGKSSAMIADSFHSLSDFGTDIIVYLGFNFVEKPIDKTHDYGHGKAETMSSVIVGVALYAAFISIVTKEWLYRYSVKYGNMIRSQAVIANAWHHRSDALSSIGAAIGIGGAILLGEKWHILDPIAAVVVSILILKAAMSISLSGFNELLDASLCEETENKIMDLIKKVPGVVDSHDLKTRKIGNYISVDVHINVGKQLSIIEAHDISSDAENKLKEEFGEEAIISIHIEPAE